MNNSKGVFMKVFTFSQVLLATFLVTNLDTLAVQKYFFMHLPL